MKWQIVRAIALVAAMGAPIEPSNAQVYSWVDPETGGRKLSNIPPPWYKPAEPVTGPRVVVTVGREVVDDTALPIESRRRMSSASPDDLHTSGASQVQPRAASTPWNGTRMYESDAEREQRLLALVKEQLRDPDSAQFSNVRLNRERTALCGRLNARNAMGGYVGTKGFMVVLDKETVLIDSADPGDLLAIWYRQLAPKYGCDG